jgi:hypothetical protein
MKQKIILICLTVCFCLSVIEVRADSIQVWKNLKEEHLDQLTSALEPQGWYDPQRGIATEGLATNAYWLASDNNLLAMVDPENRDIDSYKNLFKQENGLTAEYISVNQFFAQANNRGFFLPSASKQESQFAELQARLRQLETAVQEGDQQAKAELADFKSRLNQYGIKLDKLVGVQSVVRQLEETQTEQSQRLSTLSTKVDGQGSQISELRDFDRELSMQVALIESKLNSQQTALNQLRDFQREEFDRIGSDVELLKKVPGYSLVRSLGGENLAETYDDLFYYLIMLLAFIMLAVAVVFSILGNRPRSSKTATFDQPLPSQNVTPMSRHRQRTEKSKRDQAA